MTFEFGNPPLKPLTSSKDLLDKWTQCKHIVMLVSANRMSYFNLKISKAQLRWMGDIPLLFPYNCF